MARASGGLSRVKLDNDLEKYMKGKTPTATANIAAKVATDEGRIDEITGEGAKDGGGDEVTREEPMCQEGN